MSHFHLIAATEPIAPPPYMTGKVPPILRASSFAIFPGAETSGAQASRRTASWSRALLSSSSTFASNPIAPSVLSIGATKAPIAARGINPGGQER